MHVTVIDYKAGNLTSVLKTLRHLGAEPVVTDGDLSLVESAERIVLPGVGHFAATERLDATGMTGAIRAAIARGVPFLGICVGMQWLMEGSEEAPDQPGLGYFFGRCKRFRERSEKLPLTGWNKSWPEGEEKVPHVGWNHVLPRVQPSTRLLGGIQATGGGEYAYFTHSYYVPQRGPTGTLTAKKDMPLKSRPSGVAGLTQYMDLFVSAVEHENVMGVQFHPEKSGATGLKILRNFLAWDAKGAPC